MRHEVIRNTKNSLMIKFIKEVEDQSTSLYVTKVINELKEGRDIDKLRWFGDLDKEDESVLAIIF